jgi:hypothetical protein
MLKQEPNVYRNDGPSLVDLSSTVGLPMMKGIAESIRRVII